MTASRGFFSRTSIRLVLTWLLMVASILELQAADLKIEARLIWGTNDEKFSDPKYKPVDKATHEKLQKVFKWHRYYEVNRKQATIPSRGSKKIQMSPQSVIEIKELEGHKVEVTLFGEGQPINKTTYHLTKGESFAIAGDCKDGSAWFILITELADK